MNSTDYFINIQLISFISSCYIFLSRAPRSLSLARSLRPRARLARALANIFQKSEKKNKTTSV